MRNETAEREHQARINQGVPDFQFTKIQNAPQRFLLRGIYHMRTIYIDQNIISLTDLIVSGAGRSRSSVRRLRGSSGRL